MQALSSLAPPGSPAAGYSAAVRKSDEKLKRPPMAQRLVELRQAAGLTQQQLADQIGVDQSNIAFWERWGKAPRGEVLPKMAHALGVTVDELLGVAPPKRRVAKGQLQEVFQEASRLPRRQQQKLAEFVRVFLAQNADANP